MLGVTACLGFILAQVFFLTNVSVTLTLTSILLNQILGPLIKRLIYTSQHKSLDAYTRT